MQNKINIDHTEVQPVFINTLYFQIAFWTILTVVTFFSLTLWYGISDWKHVAHTLLQSFLGALITIPMHKIYLRIWNFRALYLFIFISFVVLFFSFIWSAIRLATFIWLTDEGAEVWSDFGGWYFSGFFIFLCWTALYFSLRYYRLATEEKYRRIKLVEKSRAEKVKRLQAEKLATDFRMQMLRYQLNPHFLFNTLNAISALVKTNDSEQARKMITKLSNFLRYVLKDEKEGLVDLAGEIEALELYLSIEKVRFDERLKVIYEIETNSLSQKVPSLLLQPLVENSIKHAINAKEQGVTIIIQAYIVEKALVIVIKDDGPGISKFSEGEISPDICDFNGVGIKNIVDRVNSIKGTIIFINHKGMGLEVEIKLPLNKKY